MIARTDIFRRLTAAAAVAFCAESIAAEASDARFNVVGFYTGRIEPAHISFVKEANQWFPKLGLKYNFAYEATTNWQNLNPQFLAQRQVVVFLDTRPEVPDQRRAFADYMEQGGAWMGFHFAGFALTPSEFPQDWN